MPSLKTEITEIITGLGTLSHPGPAQALAARPRQVLNVAESTWVRLEEAWRRGEHREQFLAAWDNGVALLHALDGLRGRTPERVEWKGPHHPPAYDFLPADLRIDHVYLVSCKYLSKILVNASPFHLFRRALDRTAHRTVGDWYLHAAPGSYQELYRAAKEQMESGRGLPDTPEKLDREQRKAIKAHYHGRWPASMKSIYREFSLAVAEASCRAWKEALPRLSDREVLLWRMLRLNSAPYFVLGASPAGSLRLRIATPWDWRQQFELRAFEFRPESAGQPTVGWTATVFDRDPGREVEIRGHVEVRWSHGKFCGAPEAKVYLDTDYQQVPGYFPLAPPG